MASMVHRGRLMGALVAAVTIVAAAPFAGQLRHALRAAFPEQFQIIVSGAVVVVAGVTLIAAALRIREHRLWRYAALAIGVLGAAVYAVLVASGNAEVDVVERVHFVEYGLLAWLLYRAWRPADNGFTLAWTLLAGCLTGVADEFLQWYIPARVGEIHDVLIDGVAVLCGLCVVTALDPLSRYGVPMERSPVRLLARAGSIVVLTIAAFFHLVHLGHQVYQSDIGMFWSRFTSPELMALATDRAARWRMQPPVTFAAISREDQYLSEGMWHVQARNLAATADDPFTAWRENRILEVFFAPVLESPSYLSAAPPHWPPEQLEQMASRVAADPGVYISRAAPYPIYTWSPMVFWLAIALLVAAVLTAC